MRLTATRSRNRTPKRQAFNRAVRDAQARSLIGVREIELNNLDLARTEGAGA